MDAQEIIDQLEVTLGEVVQQMTESKAEVRATLELARKFRRDFDALMDAVHYYSLMYDTPQEADALRRLQMTYTRLHADWD